MATKIAVNRHTYQIRQPVIDAIRLMDRQIRRNGRTFAVRGEFERGSGRYRSNPIASLGHGLEQASGGALKIHHSHPAAQAAHPRAHAFVLIANMRRFNLVLKKLDEAK
tara:strand:+ start:345 stop:671 length:327 start_codon:yes stop_codon:yes gene_type:complete